MRPYAAAARAPADRSQRRYRQDVQYRPSFPALAGGAGTARAADSGHDLYPRGHGGVEGASRSGDQQRARGLGCRQHRAFLYSPACATARCQSASAAAPCPAGYGRSSDIHHPRLLQTRIDTAGVSQRYQLSRGYGGPDTQPDSGGTAGLVPAAKSGGRVCGPLRVVEWSGGVLCQLGARHCRHGAGAGAGDAGPGQRLA